MSIITVENIRKSYNNFQALKGLSFEVGEGEIFGFLGPNGAGKTTTIKILTAQIRPDEGSVRVLGLDPLRQADEIHRYIGIVFEEQNFYPRLTVLQNLNMFAKLYGVGKDRVDKALDYAKLFHKKNDIAKNLSKGLKQRLLIARALLPDPRIIFLDEPTVGLDPHIARDIRNIFCGLRNMGKTIFLTTHYMEEADELCDRLAIINEGFIVAVDTPENLKMRLGSGEILVKILDSGGKVSDTKIFANDNAALVEYLEELKREKVSFGLETRRVSLEDVFIKMTGAALE